MADEERTTPVRRSFRLATDGEEKEIDSIGIGLTLLSELEPRAKMRVAEYWLSYAQQHAADEE
jgi:hypothetical protein